MGIRDAGWKYIRRMKDGAEELYDLSTDPDEKKNIADSRKEITARYRKAVTAGREYKLRFYENVLKK